ncbi:hypothetical protein LEN26_018688 [Aphanomyces euteiches]|nr:hypothetical protein LEN26_018688 [Aphanomyces euteiches]KAH9107357.1 hypothetical protein AeMF1_017298 [Aphanomyces euteiches]KAH9185875.1 hypothetical protein AeNC1_012151 [Aphanomyces euteiches]
MSPLLSNKSLAAATTTYAFQVACRETKTSWTLRRRYAHFVAVQNKLCQLERASMRLPSVRSLLRPIVEMELTTLDASNPFYDQLQAFAGKLAQIRLECMALATVPQQNDRLLYMMNEIYALLTAFLQVPPMQVEEELRCVVATASCRSDVVNQMLDLLDTSSPSFLIFELNDIFRLRSKFHHSTPSSLPVC